MLKSQPSSFLEILKQHPPQEIIEQIEHVRAARVEQALHCAGAGTLEDFLALISPAASEYLPEMAAVSQTLTRKRFGKTIKFFVPIYLSNECHNICTYCGFSYTNQVPRITLSEKEVLKEIAALKKFGYDRVLILTGEHSSRVGMDYFKKMIPLFKAHFSEVMLEVQPLESSEYKELRALGLDGVTIYQETYHSALYKKYHPRGKKANFSYRLATPERAGMIGIHKLGIGALLGLAPWRCDSYYTALHYKYLHKRFWQCEYTVSFPRLRPAEKITVTQAGQNTDYFPTERDLAQLIFAYRIFDEDLGLSLSTRERQLFRDYMIPLGITALTAGSQTNPGGYACYPKKTLEQFSIEDTRSPAAVTKRVRQLGLDPVFKDWMREFSS
ncbi:2-iminoacetate synthase [Spirochaetota bacterium]|nr:2-iminoacetate synthase [Spirochaetota bacterium]